MSKSCAAKRVFPFESLKY